ncbi:MAG: TadE/TadG family type IV pilus assembly protein [Pseudolabrys sp.]
MTKRRSSPRMGLIARFIRGIGGTAAIEFALVVPIIAGIILPLPDVGNIASGDMDMESAVRMSAQYAMNGGTDATVAQALGNGAWQSKPSNGVLTVTEACVCGSSSGTCGQTCTDGSQPQTYMTVSASGTFGGSVVSLPLTTTQVVRIQ